MPLVLNIDMSIRNHLNYVCEELFVSCTLACREPGLCCMAVGEQCALCCSSNCLQTTDGDMKRGGQGLRLLNETSFGMIMIDEFFESANGKISFHPMLTSQEYERKPAYQHCEIY